MTQEQFQTVTDLFQLRAAIAHLCAVRLPDDEPTARAALACNLHDLQQIERALWERLRPLIEWEPRVVLDPDLVAAVLAECSPKTPKSAAGDPRSPDGAP